MYICIRVCVYLSRHLLSMFKEVEEEEVEEKVEVVEALI